MRFLIIIILLTILPDDLNEISRINRLKREAAKAYKEGAYDIAVNKYRTLIDSIGVDDDRILLNLSNAYYKQNDTTNAIPYYQQLLNSNQNDIRSIAHQQMGVISNDQQKYDEALTYFKGAIKSDPTNADARYNYELLKKLMQEQQQQQQNQQNQDQQQDQKDQQENQQRQDQEQQQEQQNQDQQEQDQQEQEQEQQQEQQDQQQQQEQEQEQQEQEQQEQEQEQQQGGQKEEQEEMQISEEKARMILEAMKNNEVQYLQQMQRKPTKKKDDSKPDW